jgi:hypothetical protein
MQLRAHVQELTVPQTAASYSMGQRDDFEDRDYVAQLVEHLPNLRRVRYVLFRVCGRLPSTWLTFSIE